MELDVHLIQSGLHVLKVFRSLFEQIPPTAENGSQLTDRLIRPIRGLQQTNAVQILQPLTIADVAFAPGDIFDMPGIDQVDLHLRIAEKLIKRDPVDTGRLHRDGANPAIHKPCHQGLEILGECTKSPDGELATLRWYSGPDFGGS